MRSADDWATMGSAATTFVCLLATRAKNDRFRCGSEPDRKPLNPQALGTAREKTF
jgi:hypothetical protein